jgi:hypothetical protein
MHALAAQLDDIGKPAWIGVTVASFILFWPLGLVLLGYLIGSGRMACLTNGSGDRWQRRMDRMQRRMERMQAAAERWGGAGYRASSGNRAFDEYRAETLRRLEEEQREFMEFLDRLRQPGRKAEFDSSWPIVASLEWPQPQECDQPRRGPLPYRLLLGGVGGSRVAAAAITQNNAAGHHPAMSRTRRYGGRAGSRRIRLPTEARPCNDATCAGRRAANGTSRRHCAVGPM